MFRLLVECFSKYCVVREAIRHFRALRKFGGIKVLHNEGKFGDPLSLYLRALCREGMHTSFVCFQSLLCNDIIDIQIHVCTNMYTHISQCKSEIFLIFLFH